jgi:hypothetical protein
VEAVSDLTQFLLDRIAEDKERFAVEDWELEWVAAPDSTAGAGDDAYIITLHSRLLAECEAKRQIVEECAEKKDWYENSWGYRVILRLLAVPYADHPDYQQEWRP